MVYSVLARVVRRQPVAVIVVALGLIAGGAITLLELRADASRRSQARVGSVKFTLTDLENAPFRADPRSGGSPTRAKASIDSDTRAIYADLSLLEASGDAPSSLMRVRSTVQGAGPPINEIFEIGAYRGGYSGDYRGARLNRQEAKLQMAVRTSLGLLNEAGRVYSQRAARAKTEAIVGSAATILTLLAVFSLFYRRSRQLSSENALLLQASRDEAITDPLTGLGNRRAFKRDLDEAAATVSQESELLVAMFDLDGFKHYNDTFGHAAGDALLARLAGSLRDVAGERAKPYRLGGDEFCLLAQASTEQAERLVHAAVDALTDVGEGWQVGCSWGAAWMPSDATGASDTLRIADERMYAQKASRASASYQATAALVQVLVERDDELSAHTTNVAQMSMATARLLGLPDHDVDRIGVAAQLHDIGKTAIPASILEKRGPLDEKEWTFMRRHTTIGERIIAAAPALAHTAGLVRSSHERLDGTGYPDGLCGTDIPLGSRIIAVCDAYDAMIGVRPYRSSLAPDDALAELRRCAGTQFDSDVVRAFGTASQRQPEGAGKSSRRN